MGAFGVGFQLGLGAGARGGEKHADLTDEERGVALDGYNNSIKALQGKISEDPGNAAAYQSQLNQVVADRTDLFHPRHGAGAMAHLGRLFHSAAHGTDPLAQPSSTIAPNPAQMPDAKLPDGTVIPAQPNSERPTIHVQTPADAKQRMAQDLGFGAALPSQNEVAAYRAKMIGGGFSPEDAEKATRIHFQLDPKPVATKPEVETWKRDGQPYKGKDGKFYVREMNKAGVPRETALPDNFQPPANMKQSQFEREMTAYAHGLGKAIDDLTFEEYQDGLAKLKQAVAPSTENSRQVVEPTPDGDLVTTTLHSSSRKVYPGSGGRATAPRGGEAAAPSKADTSAGTVRRGARAAMSAGQASPSTPTNVVGHRNTPAQAKAEADVGASKKMVSLADDAWHHPSSAKDKQLVLSLIRTTAGRVNLSEFNIYTQRAGLGNSLEAFANSISTGQLPIDVRRQLVALAHTNLKAATDARDSEYEDTAYAKKPAKAAAKKAPAKSAGKAMTDDEFLMGVGGGK